MEKLSKQLATMMVCLFMSLLTFSANNIYAQLVTNGSFENAAIGPVTGNDIEGWSLLADADVNPVPIFEIVADTVQQGTQALMIVVNAIGANSWGIQVVANNIPVKPGAKYRYSIWAKSESPGAVLNFTVGNYNYNEYGAIRPANLTTNWKEFKFDFAITDQETNARAPIHFGIAANVGNAIYLDNLQIIDVERELVSRYPIIVQSESGVVGVDFAVKADGEISYIQIQTDGADFAPAIWNYPGFKRRVVSYDVTFPSGGTYNLFACLRVGPQRYDDDSFFYGNGFGLKDTVNADDWIAVNQLQAAGFSDFSHVVHEAGGLGEGIWKWVNLSQNAYYEPATTFTVTDDDSVAVIFQIGGRETGLDIDRLAFGRADLYYTVANLENVEPGSEEMPGAIWPGPPLATGKSKFLGCTYSKVQTSNFKAYWNQVTPENASKWGSVEGTRDVMNWSGLDAAYNFAKTNGFPFRFHVLIWGNQQPAWIEALANSPQQQLAEIREWFEAVAARYPDIDYLEVVNEPIHDPPAGPSNGNYIEALGGTGATGWDWVLNAFKMARQIFPSTTKLLINEFSVLNESSNLNQYLKIIRLLQRENLIDGIGVQGHAFSTRGATTTMIRGLDSLKTTGLPVQITEMDIDGPTDQTQLTDYKRIFPAFWEHPAVSGITLWGWRPGLWRNAEKAYLVDLNGAERPALTWLRDYVSSAVSVEDHIVNLPQVFKLYNNYPNPFNPSTQIAYSIPKKDYISLKVYNLLGEEVATLFQGVRPAGNYIDIFDGSALASGVYLYQLRANNFMVTKKLILLK